MTNIVGRIVYRSARTGRFVAEAFARRFPSTTLAQRITPTRSRGDYCPHCGKGLREPSPDCLFRERHDRLAP